MTQEQWDRVRSIIGEHAPDISKKIPKALTVRPPPEEIAARASIARQKHLDILRVDPLGDDANTASIYAPVIMGRATPEETNLAGNLLCAMMRDATAQDLKTFLENIANMKAKVETPKPPAYAYLAYCMMIEESGNEPAFLNEIRYFILDHPQDFDAKKMPDPTRASDWQRMFKQAGIDLPWE